MNKRKNTYPHSESNPHNNNNPKIGYYFHSDNNYSRGTKKPEDTHINTYSHGVINYQKAVIEAFKLLSFEKAAHPRKLLKFDQELCKTLVLKYGLSCSDCKLKCELHELEALK